MNKGLLFAAVLVVSGLVVGRQRACEEQVFLPPAATMDVNQIAVDPVSGERLLVATHAAIVGREFVLVGHACDPDPNDSLRMFWLPDGPEITLDAEGAFALQVRASDAGWVYCNVAVTDGDLERHGTYAVYFRVNTAPSLCGGQP